MTAPAGSEDAGLVLSAEEREALRAWLYDHNGPDGAGGLAGLWGIYQRLVAARVEAARVEERERVAAAIADKAERNDPDPLTRPSGWFLGLRDAARIARTPPPAGDAQGSECGACYRCVGNKPAHGSGFLTVGMTRMIVCPDCGNKRCPHSTDHDLPCTASNEPGQPGSRYEAHAPAPQEARNGPVGAEDAGDGRGHGRDDESDRGVGL